jgi:hypothetical protein
MYRFSFRRLLRDVSRPSLRPYRRAGRPQAARPRPAVEQLEDRTLLSIVTWVGGTGDWNTPGNWSGGALPGSADDVQITTPGISVTHSTGSHTVKSLTLSPGLLLSGGSLNVTGTVQIDGTLTVGGGSGTLNTVTVGGSGSLAVGSAGSSGTITVSGNMTLAQGAKVFLGNDTHAGTVTFQGPGTQTQTLDSLGGPTPGEVVFGAVGGSSLGIQGGTTLVLGPNLLVHGKTGAINSAGSGTFLNQGTIAADGGGTLSLNPAGWQNSGTLSASSGTLTLNGGNWHNTGQIAVSSATLNLGGSFTTADVQGRYTRSGGAINLTGTLANAGSALALTAATGPWALAGGTINGGTVTTAGGGELVTTGSGGTLNGLTLDGTGNSADPLPRR